MTGFLAIIAQDAREHLDIRERLERPSGSDGSLSLVYRDGPVSLFCSADLPSLKSGEAGSEWVAIGDIAAPAAAAAGQALTNQRELGLRRLREAYFNSPEGAVVLEDEHHFVCWDAVRQSLYAGRDALGVRPIYYARTASVIYAASAVRILLKAGVIARLDEGSVRRFVVGENPAHGRTYIENIRRLGVAERLQWAGGGLGIMVTDAPLAIPALQQFSDAPILFRGLFSEAVRKRSGEINQLTALLSGGLDSSSIATIAAGQFAAAGAGSLKTMSLVFDATPQWNERTYIEDVIRDIQIDASIYDAYPPDPFAEFSDRLSEHGGLFNAPGLHLVRSLYRRAAADGRLIVLDGHGGDEVVSHGTGRLHDLAMAGAWRLLNAQLKGIAGRDAARLLFLYYLKYGPFGRIASLTARGLKAIRRRIPVRRIKPEPYALLARHQRGALSADLSDNDDLSPKPRFESYEARDHFELVTDPGQVIALETLDAASSAAGVSARYPFWDRELLKFCLSLEGAEKLDGGYSRAILRKALSELPPSVRWRRDKLDFTPHLALGLADTRRIYLQSVVDLPVEDRLWEFFDRTEVRAYWFDLLRRRERTFGPNARAIWRVGALAAWLGQLAGQSDAAGLAELSH